MLIYENSAVQHILCEAKNKKINKKTQLSQQKIGSKARNIRLQSKINSKLDNTKRLFSGIIESTKPNNTKERR